MRRLVYAAVGSLLLAGCTQQLPQQPATTPTTSPLRAELIPIRVTEKAGTQVGADLASSSRQYVLGQRGLLGLSQNDDVVVRNVEIGVDGLKHVRMDQTFEGVKVWGSDIVVHSSDSTFKGVAGNLTVGLAGFDVNPSIGASDAMFAAKADYALQAKDASADLQFTREATELVVYPSEDSGIHLAWHCTFFTEMQNGINPGLWEYFIDAHSGAIVQKWNSLYTTFEASGPGGNAKVSRTWSNDLDVEQSGSSYVMNTAKAETTNLNHGTSGTGTPFSGSTLTATSFNDAAINDAHGFALITLKVLNDWYGYNSIDNQGYKILSRVHYSTNYENAYWDGTQMTYGDGASMFYPLSGALDVVAHEIDHGFTSFHSNLQYSGMPGGMNEAFSDIAGTAAEWYYDPAHADFLVGEDIFKSSGALRNQCHQSDDGSSIDNAGQYNSGLDPHYSSGVMNGAFCHASKRVASGDPNGTATQDAVHKVAKAFFVANANYWTSSSTFTQGCQGVVDAATSLGYSATDIAAITAGWSDVGVSCGNAPPPPTNCDETLTGESGTITSPNYPNAYGNNYNHTWCIQPASGSPATLTFSDFNTESGYDFVTIKDANGQQLSKTSGTTKPADATSTKIVVNFTSDASVTKTGFKATWSTGGATNQAPQVSLTSPANNSTVSGSVTVAASASDSDGSIAKVTFTLPGMGSVDVTSSPYQVSWDTTAVADGTYTISAVATDDMGATSGTASRTVTVSNGGSTGCVDGTFNATGLPMSIPDNNTTGITSSLSVTGSGTVASLALSLHITHTYRGDLVVTLIGPDGTTYSVSNRSGGSADNVVLTGSAVTAFNGKTAAGTWQMKVQDLAAVDTGTLDSWSLAITGSCSGGGGGGGGNWSGSASPNMPTVDNGSACTTLSVADTGNAADVKLDISGRHDYRSILRGTLSHNGTTVEAFPTGTFPSNSGTFSFTNRAIAGFSGDATGTWQLCIIDTDAYGDTGTLNTWSVHN